MNDNNDSADYDGMIDHSARMMLEASEAYLREPTAANEERLDAAIGAYRDWREMAAWAQVRAESAARKAGA